MTPYWNTNQPPNLKQLRQTNYDKACQMWPGERLRPMATEVLAPPGLKAKPIHDALGHKLVFENDRTPEGEVFATLTQHAVAAGCQDIVIPGSASKLLALLDVGHNIHRFEHFDEANFHAAGGPIRPVALYSDAILAPFVETLTQRVKALKPQLPLWLSSPFMPGESQTEKAQHFFNQILQTWRPARWFIKP